MEKGTGTMSAITTAIGKIKDTLIDFSTLTVTTYSGNLKVIFNEGQADQAAGQPSQANLNNLDLDKLFSYTIGDVNTDPTLDPNSKVTLMAMNVHKIDGDAILFRDDNIPEKLETAHKEAVTAGRETREGILNLVKSAL